MRERLENRLVWSKSRQGLFERCEKAYWYNYYGAWEGWREDAPPEVRELYVLKNLSTRATWAGRVVHKVCEMVVNNHLSGREFPLEDAERVARAKLRCDYIDSVQGRYFENPKRHVGLQEHHYKMEVSDAEWKESAALVDTCLQNLYNGAIYRRLQALPVDAVLDCERVETFLIGAADAPGQGVLAYAIPDLVLRGKKGGVVILDWKTSEPSTAQSAELQLNIYADFVARDYELPPEQVIAGEVFLRDGTVKWYTIDAASVQRARQVALEGAERMRGKLRDPAVNEARVEDFAEVEDRSICADCCFRGPCGKL